jgi:hypothetical protein
MEGGCFFLNMLVELAGQSAPMTSRIFEGIQGFSNVVRSWLEEAAAKEMLKSELNHDEFRTLSLFPDRSKRIVYGQQRSHYPETGVTKIHFYIKQWVRAESKIKYYVCFASKNCRRSLHFAFIRYGNTGDHITLHNIRRGMI